MSDAPDTPEDRWPRMREQLLGMIAMLVGRPLPDVILSGKGLLTPAENLLVLKWLRPLERLVRSFLMMAATFLPGGGPTPPHRPFRDDFGKLRAAYGPAQGPLVRKGFRVLTGHWIWSHDGRIDPETNEHYSAWKLVERLDAVLDAIDNPAPHIARLARRLGRLPRMDRIGVAEAKPRVAPQHRGVSDLAYPYLVAERQELIVLLAAMNTS